MSRGRGLLIVAIVVSVLMTAMMGFAVTAAAEESGESDEKADEQTEEVWDSQTFQHSPGVILNDVQFEDGHAIIYMTADSDGANIVITDSSRETSGEMERSRFELSEGENVFRVSLHNPSNEAVTIDAAGRLYAEFGDDGDVDLLPAVPYPIIAVLGGGTVALALIIGLHQLANRKSQRANNPLK